MPPSPDTTFLTILRATMDEIDSILPLIQDNIYLRLVNNLQSLYNIHTTNITNTTNTITITNDDNNTITITNDENNTIGDAHYGITNNINITNFDTTLLVAEYMRENMTPEQRELHIASVNPLFSEEYRNNINNNNPIFRDYNRQISQVVDLWENMSSEDQRNYITRPQNVLHHSSRQYNIFPFYRSNRRSEYSTYIINILNTNNSAGNTNITNFMRVLSVLDTTYDYWTSDERSLYDNSVNPNNTEEYRNNINSRYPIFTDYNRLMREALDYWEAMSFDEQRNIRNGPHVNNPSFSMMNNIIWGGPIERIINII